MKRRTLSLLLFGSLCLLLSTLAVAGDIPLYDNGSLQADFGALPIYGGYQVTNSFTLAKSASVESIAFWVWLNPGVTMTSVEALVTTSAFGGSTLFDQVLAVTQSGCFNNNYGYSVCQETAMFKNVPLGPGNYWLQLENAANSIYWYVNGGVGCGGSDGKGSNCPSSAYIGFNGANFGPQVSEAFTINGSIAEPDGLMTMFGGGFLVLAGVSLRKLKVFHRSA